MRRSTPVAALVATAALFASVAAHAVPLVQVSYQFDSTNSVLAMTSPIAVSIPPSGTVSGDIVITFTSNDAGDILDGPATLDVFDLAADLNVSGNLFGPFTLTGPANAELVDPVAGTLTGNQLDFGGAPGDFHAFGTVTCTGTPCSLAGLVSGTPTDFDKTGPVPLPTLTLGSIHGTISNLNFGIGGISANLTFDAPETAREVVPQPSTALLLGFGLSGLATRRRRRR